MALVVLTTAFGAAWFAVTSADGVPGVPTRAYTLEFKDLSGLGGLNEVRVGGRRIGQTLDPRLENGRATIDVQLEENAPPVPQGSRFVVRSKGLLGQRFLELVPGTSTRLVTEGSTLPAEQTADTVQLPDVLNTLDTDRRGDVQELVSALGEGSLGRGEDMRTTLRQAPDVVGGVGSTADAVLDRTGAAARLAPSAELGMTAIDGARPDLVRGFAPTADALDVLAANRDPIDTTLADAPRTLPGIRDGLGGATPLLRSVQRLSRSTVALRRAPAGLRATDALFEALPQPLERTQALLKEVRPVVRPVLNLTRNATTLLPRVEDGLRDVEPLLADLAPRKCDLASWARNWASMLSWGVQGGGEVGPLNVLRLELITGPEVVAGLTTHPLGNTIGKNPYPAPCEAGTERLP